MFLSQDKRFYDFFTVMLDSFEVSTLNTRPIVERVIAEISAELKNHGVQPDQSKLSKNNIEVIKLINLVIECRRMFHESEQGVRTFSEAIATIHFNKFKSPLLINFNFTELIDCFERQRKHHQMEADRRNGSMCYVDLPSQHIEVIQKVDWEFDNFYSMYYEFSKYMCKYIKSMHFNGVGVCVCVDEI
ncbi:hypothetical protein MS3_00011077 [Schistosoma haematobium]|uniref:Uncharacterized protein n=1 Tax=Schistosoma haematobium TaxID=6185 RepID=A0A922ILD9_SCHHA|nr:hypothetical protein MS3_00011077 [Schistosoma haematobium]KAH9581804.1 hypothetical protein MS3_00011077 [Schistosoma haematobium]